MLVLCFHWTPCFHWGPRSRPWLGNEGPTRCLVRPKKKKKDHLGVFVWVYFWILCSIPLIYRFIPPPILVFVLATSCCFWNLSFLTKDWSQVWKRSIWTNGLPGNPPPIVVLINLTITLEVVDISPCNLDTSLCFIQPGILHDVLCI